MTAARARSIWQTYTDPWVDEYRSHGLWRILLMLAAIAGIAAIGAWGTP